MHLGSPILPGVGLGRMDRMMVARRDAVDMGAYDAEVHACNLLEDCATPGKSNFPVSPVVTVQTTDFVAREAAAAELMRNVSFTNALMNGLLAWKEENNASADETAVHFITNHSDVWSGWINDDARAKLAALIK